MKTAAKTSTIPPLRAMQQEFVARGLAARDEARSTGNYVSVEVLLAGLDKSLAKARKAASRK